MANVVRSVPVIMANAPARRRLSLENPDNSANRLVRRFIGISATAMFGVFIAGVRMLRRHGAGA